MLLVMGHVMVSGSKKTLITISDVILADCILLCLALLGVGAVLYSSAVAFNVMSD
jgi:threonine/homoserine/homoserine lactone efflux protein